MPKPALSLDALGVPLIEMRCPLCRQTQYAKVRGLRPHLSRCCHCHCLLVYSVQTREKPNHVLLTLLVSPVPERQTGEGAQQTEEKQNPQNPETETTE